MDTAVSIIIVNYNTKELLKKCLSSIYAQTKDISFEVIVSDNGSVDGSNEMVTQDFPQVILLQNNQNLGFGKANNQALRIAKGKYIFYLNSDTVLLNNAPKIFYDYWESYPKKETLGAIGANLINEKNELIHSCGVFRDIHTEIKAAFFDLLRSYKNSIPIVRKIPMGNAPKAQKEKIIGNVNYVTGADLFVKNNVYAYFDERYFLYYEDTDLQKTMELAGLERRIIDGPLIQHIKGQSCKSTAPISFYKSISKINTFLSSCYFQKKYYNHTITLFLLKCIIFFIWINPLLLTQTFAYIPKLFMLPVEKKKRSHFYVKDKPLFSILIANYNNAHFLKECIDSIKAQTYTNWEVIFVDDCSTDSSLQHIKALTEGDSRFYIYQNEQNHGCGYTKDRCARLAHGTICGYVDPDDTIAPEALLLMVKMHVDYPEVSLIGSRRYFCDKNLKVVDVAKPLKDKIKQFKNQLDTPFVITHFATFKKAAYDKSPGLDPYMKRGVDQDLYLKLEEQGKVAFIDKPLYYYRNNANSISLNNNYYKATSWHVYAIIKTCQRRRLDFDKYCYLTKPKKNIQERFINKLLRPLSILKQVVVQRHNLTVYKKETDRSDIFYISH